MRPKKAFLPKKIVIQGWPQIMLLESKHAIYNIFFFLFLCSYNVTDIKKLESHLPVVLIKFGYDKISVPEIGLPMSKPVSTVLIKCFIKKK